jgi:hypothetical protein
MRARRRIDPLLFVPFVLGGVGGCANRAPNAAPPWVAGQEERVLAAASVLPDDPDAAFTGLSRRLLAASSIDIAVEIESGAPFPALLTGTLALRTGNRLELSADGQFKGEPVHLRLRSAGGRLVGGPHGDGDAVVDLPTPAQLNEAVIVGLLGMGVLHNLALLSFGQPPDHAAGGAAAWLVTTNHVWDTGRDGDVDGRPGRALAFDINVDGQKAADATLWLDAATGLPLKREVNVHFSGEGDDGATSGTMHVSESYLKFDVTP